MARLSDARLVGGIGSILILLAIINPLLSIVGLILILIAVKYVSEIVQDYAIFRNMIYSIVVGIIGIVVFVAVGLLLFGHYAFQLASLQDNLSSGRFQSFIFSFLIELAILWLTLIISAIFARKSYDGMAEKLGVRLFSTAGLFYFIGSILVIIFGLGLILVLVAIVLTIVGFFTIPDQLPMQNG